MKLRHIANKIASHFIKKASYELGLDMMIRLKMLEGAAEEIEKKPFNWSKRFGRNPKKGLTVARSWFSSEGIELMSELTSTNSKKLVTNILNAASTHRRVRQHYDVSPEDLVLGFITPMRQDMDLGYDLIKGIGKHLARKGYLSGEGADFKKLANFLTKEVHKHLKKVLSAADKERLERTISVDRPLGEDGETVGFEGVQDADERRLSQAGFEKDFNKFLFQFLSSDSSDLRGMVVEKINVAKLHDELLNSLETNLNRKDTYTFIVARAYLATLLGKDLVPPDFEYEDIYYHMMQDPSVDDPSYGSLRTALSRNKDKAARLIQNILFQNRNLIESLREVHTAILRSTGYMKKASKKNKALQKMLKEATAVSDHAYFVHEGRLRKTANVKILFEGQRVGSVYAAKVASRGWIAQVEKDGNLHFSFGDTKIQ